MTEFDVFNAPGKSQTGTELKSEHALKKPIPLVIQPEGEQNGPAGLEPTRYGDWENKGRCTDF